LDVEEPRDEVDHRRLPGAGRADDRERASRRNLEGDIVQFDRLAVGEADTAELDLSSDGRGDGIDRVSDLRHRVEDLLKPSERGPARLEHVGDPADVDHRHLQEVEVRDELHERTDGELAADGVLATDVEDGEHGDPEDEADRRPDEPLHRTQGDRAAEILVVHRREVVRHASHEVADALVLEVREVHSLEVGEEVIAHAVLGLAGGIEHHVARAGAQPGLDRREQNDEKGKVQHVVELHTGFLERVDDLADESRRDHGREGATCSQADTHQKLQSVAGQVMEEGRACGGHSVTSLAFPRRISRVDLPPIQTIATIVAKPTKTGATPQRSAIRPTTTSGMRLKIETSMVRKPNTRPRIWSGSSSWRSVID